MTKLKIKGEGNIIKGKLKQAGAKLTDDTLLDVKGKSQELLGRVQKKAGEIPAAVKKSHSGRCE
jgi:uncharacterized protein YjbJ (UPF0337 family)